MSAPEETSQQREQRLQRILQEVERRLRQSLPSPYQSLEKTEQEVYEIGEALKQVIQKETLSEATDKQETLARVVGCGCGKAARYVGMRSRQVITRNGVSTLWRAYYHCGGCHRGFCPLDSVWQLGTGSVSVGVRALLCRFASFLPFSVAARELETVCGIGLSANTVRRQAQAVGNLLRQDWAHQEQRLWQHPEAGSGKRPHCLHLTMDGVMVLVGKEWREVKVACAYDHTHQETVRQARYYATLSASQAFGKRARVLAHTSGADSCPKMATLADGAEWIWQEVGKYFPTKTQIVDYYHVVQHLWEVAGGRFGRDASSAQAWIDTQQERLLSERVAEVIADIGQWATRTQEQQDIRRRVMAYLQTHQHRMRYKTFREAGYHIGSGVGEASCKNVVQARFKGVGMRWSAEGAEAMLHLRATWCGSDFTDFRETARRV
jgi:hypothetical protein